MRETPDESSATITARCASQSPFLHTATQQPAALPVSRCFSTQPTPRHRHWFKDSAAATHTHRSHHNDRGTGSAHRHRSSVSIAGPSSPSPTVTAAGATSAGLYNVSDVEDKNNSSEQVHVDMIFLIFFSPSSAGVRPGPRAYTPRLSQGGDHGQSGSVLTLSPQSPHKRAAQSNE
jgi:hypothetical protein